METLTRNPRLIGGQFITQAM